MSGALVVMCLAALGLVAAATSILTAVTLPIADRVTGLLARRARTRVWSWVAVLPALLGATVVVATLLPAIGIGSDHCLLHGPHHPHLCPDHLAGMPGALLIGLAALVAARLLFGVIAFVHGVVVSLRTQRTLAEGSERDGDLFVFEDAEPQAFVLGVLSPAVYASRGLVSMDPEVVAPVLAHERAHARGYDSLWRALCPLLGALHMPFVSSRIAARLGAAQEMAADEAAARAVGDPLRVAESLISLARARLTPARGLSFTDGDIDARLRALVEPQRASRAWPARLLVFALVLTVAAIGVMHERVHHALETVLGILG